MLLLLILAFSLFAPAASVAQTPTLNIYVIDVEGGNSVLFVSPSHESLLMDTGNVGAVAAPRDAGRIVDAMKDAGVDHIDHLITTHWHGDHYGAMAELASRFQIREFIDHGPNTEPNSANVDTFIRETYPKLYANAKHTVAKPGDKISMTGLDVRVVTSAGETIKAPLPGAGKPNPYCASFTPGQNNVEDPKSVGIYIAFGKFRALDLADDTKNIEFELMCPNNRIGSVDALLGLHHGQASSNSVVLVDAIRPRVAILNNGTRKGGEPELMKILHSAPGLEDVWQLHFSLLSGQEYSSPGMFIANTTDDQPAEMPIAPIPAPVGRGGPRPPVHNGPAYWIKLAAQQDGTFIVTNARNGFSKTYAPR